MTVTYLPISSVKDLEQKLKDLQNQIDEKNSVVEKSETIDTKKGKTYYRLWNVPKSNTLVNVYLNGVLLHEGEDNDYILIERRHVVLMFPPLGSDKLTVHYKV